MLTHIPFRGLGRIEDTKKQIRNNPKIRTKSREKKLKTKIFMKTKILFIALVILMGATNIASAQKQGTKEYNFAYATYKGYEYKEFYVSSILNGLKDDPDYINSCINAVSNQWNKFLGTFIENSYKLDCKEWVWLSDYDKVSDSRVEMIKSFKQKGFSIHYIDDFYYRQDRRK